jgi:hypothetical protein
MVFPSGNAYEGEWAGDVKAGAGAMAWHTLGQRYSGQWARDLPNGLGEHTWEAQVGAPAGGHATCLAPNRCGRRARGRLAAAAAAAAVAPGRCRSLGVP